MKLGELIAKLIASRIEWAECLAFVLTGALAIRFIPDTNSTGMYLILPLIGYGVFGAIGFHFYRVRNRLLASKSPVERQTKKVPKPSASKEIKRDEQEV